MLRAPLMAAALMVLVGLVASQQVLSALAGVQEARLRELTRLHVDGLSVALGPYVLRKDVWEIYDTLDRASSAGDGRRMVLTAVADDAGWVLAASDPDRAPVDSPLADIAAGAQALDAITVDPAGLYVRVLAPLDYQGRTVGQIMTELDVADLVTERRQAGLYLLIGNALATGVLALGGYLAMRRMLRPISTLARHMGEGQGSPRPIPDAEIPRGDTEVARLFRTYNTMSGAVEAKAEAERRLAERERFVSLGRLSSSLAHEINNPLGGLLNAADTIRHYADRPEVVRNSATLLERGLRHLRDVARATLDHNPLDRVGTPLRPDDFEDLRLLIAPEIARQGQALEWRVETAAGDIASLPAGPIRQVALNLLLNASSAAGRGGTVALRVASGAQGIAINVRDNGPGLPDAALRRLLSSEPVHPGGGVGLRLVRDLVAELGGRIEHERTGATTTITVVFRRAPMTAEVA
jgi:signal transduction histidine kinase